MLCSVLWWLFFFSVEQFPFFLTTEIARLKDKVDKLEKRFTLSVDERLSFWSNAVPRQ
jgi:alkyl hydroperoxide reductase subunit AhpC